jgi:pilus assembly protein CpaB
MRPITIILISVALLIAGGLAFFSKRLVEGQVARAVKSAEEADTVQVLVAARSIGTGKVLDANDLRYDKWPKAVASGQSVIVRKGTDDPRKDYINYVARRDLFAGEPIGASAVHRPDAGAKLSVLLDPGMRAITINITAESAIAGLAVPGDRVDVILTADLSRFGGETRSGATSEFLRYVSEPVLRNVKLLAIDQTVTRESTGKDKDAAKAVAGQVGKTATVEVTAEQAEKLILAGQMGKLSLILRSVAESPDDRASEYTTDVEISSALSKMLGKRKAVKAGPGDEAGAAPKGPKTTKVKDDGESVATKPLIINRGGERLAR